MRELHPAFMDDLQAGRLRALLERVRLDCTLDLEIRKDYLNIYYRGGNLLRLGRRGRAYTARFDKKYARGAPLPVVPDRIGTEVEAQVWLDAFPHLKMAMDLFLGHHPKDEREVQQLIARDNNVGSVGRHTDYYVCDIEYQEGRSRFDLVAVHWPGTDRKQARQRRLVIGEVKHGDNALGGAAGLHAHVRDVEEFLSDPARVANLKAEMVGVFNQKRELGLLNSGRPLDSFSHELPVMLLILANHTPRSTRLREALSTLPETALREVLVAGSSLTGYGLFDATIRSVAEVLDLPDTLV